MLDGGPARVVRSTERQTAYRQEAARAPQEPSVSVRHTLQPEEPVAKPPRKAKSKSPRGAIIGLIIALILALGAGGYLAFQAFGPGIARSIDKSKYQAVFFDNGQVYFGNLEIMNNKYYKLTNVFYVQSDTSADENSGAEAGTVTNQKLIKRGAEVYGPEDEMIINSSQVTIIENLKPDSQVSQLIRDYR